MNEEEVKKLKVTELKEHLEDRGLSKTGNKQTLVQRLLEAVSGEQQNSSKKRKFVDEGKAEVKEEDGGEEEEEEEVERHDSKKQKKISLLDHFKEESWKEVLKKEFEKTYFKQIIKFLEEEEAAKKVILPPREDIFNAFNFTPFDKVKVVIIGQDPYFNEGQAHGLCFSVQKGVKIPPSLNTIYKELTDTIPGFKKPNHGYLASWAKQGVLMLNATLTVAKGKANSHQACGWQTFTDAAISAINAKKEGVVFLLWGGFAQKKGKLIDSNKHHILNTPHPSPMAGKGFQGSKCFKEANDILKKQGKGEINWKIE